MALRKHYRNTGARLVGAVDGGTGMPAARHAFPSGTLKSLPCPTCMAAVKAQCISSNGNVLAQVHIARRRITIRQYRADQEVLT